MNLNYIKNYLTSKIGSKVIVVYYGSRNKKEKFIGFIDKTYYNVFTVKIDNGSIKSFNYKDILTKTIKIYV